MQEMIGKSYRKLTQERKVKKVKKTVVGKYEHFGRSIKGKFLRKDFPMKKGSGSGISHKKNKNIRT